MSKAGPTQMPSSSPPPRARGQVHIDPVSGETWLSRLPLPRPPKRPHCPGWIDPKTGLEWEKTPRGWIDPNTGLEWVNASQVPATAVTEEARAAQVPAQATGLAPAHEARPLPKPPSHPPPGHWWIDPNTGWGWVHTPRGWISPNTGLQWVSPVQVPAQVPAPAVTAAARAGQAPAQAKGGAPAQQARPQLTNPCYHKWAYLF